VWGPAIGKLPNRLAGVQCSATQLAEEAVPRQLFAALLERIGRLRLAEASGEVRGD
jgi:hypothetical protein